MQTADSRLGFDLDFLAGVQLQRSSRRAVLVQGQVGAVLVVVAHVGQQKAAQVRFVEWDDVVQKVAPERADQALAGSVLPRAVEAGLFGRYAHGSDEVLDGAEPREQTSPAPAFSLSIPPKDPPLIGNRHFWLFEEGQPSSHESSLGSSWRHLAVKALQFAGTPEAPGEPWAGLKSVLAASSSSLHSQIGCNAALGFLQDSGLCKQIRIPGGKWILCLGLPRGRASARGRAITLNPHRCLRQIYLKKFKHGPHHFDKAIGGTLWHSLSGIDI